MEQTIAIVTEIVSECNHAFERKGRAFGEGTIMCRRSLFERRSRDQEGRDERENGSGWMHLQDAVYQGQTERRYETETCGSAGAVDKAVVNVQGTCSGLKRRKDGISICTSTEQK